MEPLDSSEKNSLAIGTAAVMTVMLLLGHLSTLTDMVIVQGEAFSKSSRHVKHGTAFYIDYVVITDEFSGKIFSKKVSFEEYQCMKRGDIVAHMCAKHVFDERKLKQYRFGVTMLLPALLTIAAVTYSITLSRWLKTW
jgi:hypothetical protein